MDSSKYQPPARRSLSDEELDARVNLATSTNTGVEALMELLVAQEALRAQEDAEIQAWVRQMEEEGSPEALQALAKFNGQTSVPSQNLENFEPQVEPVVSQEPEQTFSWFTNEEVEVSDPIAESSPTDQMTVEEVVELVIEEQITPESKPEPVWSETPDEFETLLVSAAAEEELTALEEILPSDEFATGPKNILIPSDKNRNRKPISQLFVWLGATATIVPIALTWTLLSFGLDLTAVIVDLAVGYLIAGSLVSIAALAGKRSGLSTSIISRAIFGVWGNSIPLTFISIARITLTALIVYSGVVLTNGVFPGLPDFTGTLVSLAGINITYGLAIASGITLVIFGMAFISGKGSRVLQFVLSAIPILLVAASFFGLVGSKLNFKVSGTNDYLSHASLAGLALVVVVVTVLWVAVGPNFSKSIPMKQRGYKVFLALLGSQVLLPVAVAIFALVWLGPEIMRYQDVVIDVAMFKVVTVNSMLNWSSTLFFAGLASALFYMGWLSLKSSTLDIVSLFRFKGKLAARCIAVILTLGNLVLFVQQPIALTSEYLSNVFALVAVLSAGWIGMFIVDVALRRIAYHELSLTRSYGFYGKFNILSFLIWLIVTAAAVLIIPIRLVGLEWTGFLGANAGLTPVIGAQAVGILAAILAAMLLTVIVRIPQIRKQEREVREVEARREQLNDIFIGQES